MTDFEGASPFVDLRAALSIASEEAVAPIEPATAPAVRVDGNRVRRTGAPEVVHAANKPAVEVASALRSLAIGNGRAMASRVPVENIPEIRARLAPDFEVVEHAVARALVVAQPSCARPGGGGTVGILSAGTSDIPIASEACLMASEMGCTVLVAWDVGIAGLHRLVAPLERFVADKVDVIVVAAGMDGALPAVVAGLVNVPVIGLPTSIGYGLGAGGVGALTTMLQSCAPGLAVVNIDNGIGAGATAALIANRAAQARTLNLR